MQAAATLIQLLNSRQLITITMFLAVNIKLATCVNPDVIFLLQSATKKIIVNITVAIKIDERQLHTIRNQFKLISIDFCSTS